MYLFVGETQNSKADIGAGLCLLDTIFHNVDLEEAQTCEKRDYVAK